MLQRVAVPTFYNLGIGILPKTLENHSQNKLALYNIDIFDFLTFFQYPINHRRGIVAGQKSSDSIYNEQRNFSKT